MWRRWHTLVVIGLSTLAAGMVCDQPTGFRRITDQPGFGDSKNKYSWSIAEFGGRIYVGTLNIEIPPIGYIIENFPNLNQDLLDIYAEAEDLVTTDGGEIWRYDPADESWMQVLDMETIDPDIIGFRNMAVYQDTLFAGTLRLGAPASIWSSPDGENWSLSHQLDGRNQSVRGLAVVGAVLYAGTENRSDMPELWRFDGNTWELVLTLDGPLMIGELTEMNGDLYFGTWDLDGGFEVYRYDGQDMERVIAKSDHHPLDLAVMGMRPFNGKLYVGSANFILGFGLYSYDPATGDVEFIKPRGFGDRTNVYAWRLEVYHDRLYVGTWKSGFFNLLTPFNRGLELWVSQDGRDFEPLVRDGFGDPTQYGVRGLLSTGDLLYVASASHMLNGPGTHVWVYDDSE